MRSIWIDYADFWQNDKNTNFFTTLLRKRFEVVLAEYPDFLIYTAGGHRHRLYSCTKIFYTQECYFPNWRECDYAITSVHVDDARAYHLPVYAIWRDAATLVRPPDLDYRALLREKSGFCSFLTGYVDRSVRNRVRFFEKLNARKKVDAAGRGLSNIGRVVSLEEKPDFIRRYKFHMAFENADLPGWTTEKLTDPFAAFSVPIFWGDNTVKEQFNPDAFIDRRDFDSDEACIDHILKVDADDELYLKYLSAPPFHDNRPNKEWDHERLLDFLEQIFSRPHKPVAQARWYWKFWKWRLAKRVKTHSEVGHPPPESRLPGREPSGR